MILVGEPFFFSQRQSDNCNKTFKVLEPVLQSMVFMETKQETLYVN